MVNEENLQEVRSLKNLGSTVSLDGRKNMEPKDRVKEKGHLFYYGLTFICDPTADTLFIS